MDYFKYANYNILRGPIKISFKFNYLLQVEELNLISDGDFFLKTKKENNNKI